MKKGSGVKMKPSGIGGMAVMEGVMMKNKNEYAVAVRKPNNEIAVEKSTHNDFSDKVKLFKLPIFRGMLAFVDSMVVGVKVLNYSASFFEEEEEALTKMNKKSSEIKSINRKDIKTEDEDSDFEIEEVSVTKMDTESSKQTQPKDKADSNTKKDEKNNTILTIFAVLISIVISVALFMVLPVLITGLLVKVIDSIFVINLIEAVVRLAIFIGYVVLASRMPEIKRVFMYHGAEHKTINCLENGFELTVENVKWQSKLHKRCGTSFLLLVILISALSFMILPTHDLLWRVVSRIILIPIIAGVSYEFIRLAGKSDHKVVNILSKPGLWMQGLTTKEPEDSMIEVAIESVSAVFDWRVYLESTSKKEGKKTAGSKSKKQTAKPLSKVKIENPAKPNKPNREEEEDDEILKALDKYFVDGDVNKAAEGE